MSVSRARRLQAPPSSVHSHGEAPKGSSRSDVAAASLRVANVVLLHHVKPTHCPWLWKTQQHTGAPTVIPDECLPSAQGGFQGPGVEPRVGAHPPGSLEDGFASQNKLMRAGPTLPGAHGAVWTRAVGSGADSLTRSCVCAQHGPSLGENRSASGPAER